MPKRPYHKFCIWVRPNRSARAQMSPDQIEKETVCIGVQSKEVADDFFSSIHEEYPGQEYALDTGSAWEELTWVSQGPK